jgi:predicted CopG family antitoxin
MVRKSISIGPDTWEALSALGKFGQSFDDVIQILLKEHNELKQYRQRLGQAPSTDAYDKEKDSKTIHQLRPEQQIPEGGEHLYSSGLQQASELKEKMDKDDQHLLHLLEMMPVISRINLPGLKFPANKNEIIECAERANTGKIIEILRENLPDKKYNSPEHIETERALISPKNKYSFAKHFKGLDKTLIVKRKIGKFTVDTREIKQEQRKQLLQQQELEFTQITKSN